MKYKLINIQTKEKIICDKVTIDGFDYYVSDEEIKIGDINIPSDFSRVTDLSMTSSSDLPIVNEKMNGYRKVIATNNPSIDIPQVVDEVEINKMKNEELINLINSTFPNEQLTLNQESIIYHHYNKSQETHPFSEEDMIEFAEWIADSKLHGYSKQLYEAMIRHKVSTTKELLQIWKEQKPKIVYYE